MVTEESLNAASVKHKSTIKPFWLKPFWFELPGGRFQPLNAFPSVATMSSCGGVNEIFGFFTFGHSWSLCVRGGKEQDLRYQC
jgi:hypothetical protein